MRYEGIFEIEKETANTYRFKEVARGKPPAVKTIYVQKWLFEREPKRIKVIIEVLE